MKRTDDAENQSKVRRRTGKIERLINEYNLIGIGDELARSWTGDPGERQSLRDLAEYFNHQLLRTTLDEAEVGPHSYDVDHAYRLLTADDVSSGVRTRMRARLEQGGIDVEQLESDFVSHLAVRTYLRHRGATRSEEGGDQVTKEAQRIQRLRSRATTVTESKLDQLRTTDRISVGDVRVFTEIKVFCEDCETRYDIDELLTRGSCGCFAETYP